MQDNKLVVPFDFEGFNIETVMINNEPYFKGKDVAGCLGYVNTSDAISTHCSNVVGKSYLDLSKGVSGGSLGLLPTDTKAYSLLKKDYTHNQIVTRALWIPESDVYNLILGSKKPEAKKFSLPK